MKLAYNVIGILAIALGVLGIFLPLLPTTPFLLLAAWCFARGSSTMHQWLMTHRLFGDYLRNYGEGRGIPLRAKIVALVMMWSSLGYAAWRFDSVWLKLALLVVGIGVSAYMVRLPSYVKSDQQTDAP